MSGGEPCALSVILVTPGGCEPVERILRALRAQTARERLELVLVAPSAADLRLESFVKDFPAVRVVEVGVIAATGEAIAAGVRAASSPLVVYAEEHSYPEPGWAAALIEAHREPWAAVGWSVSNANPRSAVSWASIFTDFGPWVAPARAEPKDSLPWHHTSYKRDVLLNYRALLPRLLESEGILHRDLRARGHGLYLESRVTSNHLNLSRFSSFLRAQFHGGRLFAATRASYECWPWPHRLLRVLAAPLIPPLRFRRVLREIRRVGLDHELLPRILPGLAAGIVMHALGELVGYAAGAGQARYARRDLELNRRRHLSRGDQVCFGRPGQADL